MIKQTADVLRAIDGALAILPLPMDSMVARVELGAIALQESLGIHRWQIIDRKQPNRKGPARGLWQFERGGGVRGVMTHPRTKRYARHLCDAFGVDFTEQAAWLALEEHDVLAAGFARLLLWADPKPLPLIGDADGAWGCYIRNWRPGRPHKGTWPANYAAAIEGSRQ